MKKISEVWFADLETATFNTEFFKKHEDTTINCFGLMNWSGDRYFSGITMAEFLNYCKTEIKKNCIIYFHNLSWDGDFIIKWLAKNGFSCVNKEDFSGAGQFCFFRSLSKIYEIKLGMPSGFGKPQIITFKCSFLLLSSSIENLAKDVGLDKYDNFKPELYDLEPQNNLSKYPQEYLDYMKRDIEIARLSVLNFSKEMDNFINNAGPHFRGFYWMDYMTIGAISYEIQRRYVLKNSKFKYCFKICQDDYKIADNFYFGGFTQFNPQIQNEITECPAGISYDINSAHPFSMTKLLPISKIYNAKHSPPPTTKRKYLSFYHLKVGRAIAKQDKLPCLINWHKINKEDGISFSQQRYVFELDNFNCYYLKEEWDLLQQFYDFYDVKIVNHYWTFADYPLKAFTYDLYEYKTKHKKAKHNASAQTYKILLNSAYGKHATREKFGDFFICQSQEEYEQYMAEDTLFYNNQEYEILKGHFTFDIENVWAIPVLKVKDKKWLSNKLIASTITAYSRIYLLEGILKLGIDNFLYCDTDSIYVKKKPKNIKIKLDDFELGAWKEEHTFSYFLCNGAKVYVIANDAEMKEPEKAVYSGISKKWLKRNYNPAIFANFDAVLEDANLKKLSCPSGLVIVPIDYKPNKRTI